MAPLLLALEENNIPNIMKVLITLVILLTISEELIGQNNLKSSDDLARIALYAYVPRQVESMSPESASLLKNKLNEIATQNGLGGSASGERFFTTCNVSVLTKDIVPGTTPMVSLTLEITLYVGDAVDGKKFSSVSKTVVGVGVTESKAYIDAIKRIKPSDTTIKDFLEQGKIKIVEFYNSQCDFILNEAKGFADQNKFDASLNKLTSVPAVCKECYERAYSKIAEVYQRKINFECSKLLADANASWSAKQDINGANSAAQVLKQILPGSNCTDDAQMLVDKISKRVFELDKREWDFKLQQYKDGVDLQKAIISAARDIGVAYGNNQPDVIYNYESTLVLWR